MEGWEREQVKVESTAKWKGGRRVVNGVSTGGGGSGAGDVEGEVGRRELVPVSIWLFGYDTKNTVDEATGL